MICVSLCVHDFIKLSNIKHCSMSKNVYDHMQTPSKLNPGRKCVSLLIMMHLKYVSSMVLSFLNQISSRVRCVSLVYRLILYTQYERQDQIDHSGALTDLNHHSSFVNTFT